MSIAPQTEGSVHWKRNLYVCAFGSFTTVMAMTLLMPFLPTYLQQLGASSAKSAVRWSGVAFGATFLAAGLVAPLWGRLADRYGRKPILIRASLGMAITVSLLGVVQSAWQLVAMRFLSGLVGGYASGAIVMIGAQAPKNRSAWAFGTHAAGMMAGNIVGPLVGGVLPGLIGIRPTFFLAGGLIFCSFTMTMLLVKEERCSPDRAKQKPRGGWDDVRPLAPVLAMLVSAMLVMFASMSIEPFITVYVSQFVKDPKRVALVAGVVISAAALGSALASPQVGRFADRTGAPTVIVVCLVVCGMLLIPQMFVTNSAQFVVLRFLMGLAVGVLLPAITSVVRHNVSDNAVGYILGYTASAQYGGQVTGPLAGGFIAAHSGVRSVFVMTSVLMFAGAAFNAWVFLRKGHTRDKDAAREP